MRAGKGLHLIILFSVLAAWPSAADDPETGLTLSDAVAIAMREHPRLAATTAALEAGLERIPRERSLPNPMLSVGAMAGRDDWRDVTETRYMLEQRLPWAGKRGLREELARQDAERVRLELDALRLDLVLQTAESVHELQAARWVLALLNEEREVLARMAAIAETLYKAGSRSREDLIGAQTELILLKRTVLEWDARENGWRARLNGLLNRPPESALRLAPVSPASGPSLPPLDRLTALALARRPETGMAETRLERSRRERALLQKENRPDFTVGIEYRDNESGDDMAMLTVGMDLPVWRARNRAAVLEAEKRIEAEEADREAVRRQVEVEVQEARFGLESAAREVSLLRDELLPQARARFSSSESAYRSGSATFLEFLESQRFCLNVRIMAAMADSALGVKAARLERAVGGPWTPTEGSGR